MTCIEEAIKLVAIGRKGSRSMGNDLLAGVLSELQKGDKNSSEKQCPDRVQEAALVTALYFNLKERSSSDNEENIKILELFFGTSITDINPDSFVLRLTHDLPSFIQSVLRQMLAGGLLSRSESETLGTFLFDIDEYPTENDDVARAVIAVWLRIRYATDDEYAGLYSAFIKNLKPAFANKKGIDQNLIQLSEPFDGVERSALLTPLISSYLRKKGFRVVSLCGDSSGPKYGVTLKEIAQKLSPSFLSSNQDHDFVSSQWGTYVDHKNVSASWAHWVKLRRRLIKRPFMATLEKFTHVMGAGTLISSAFHEAFVNKMLSLGESVGFPVNIVVKKGREGSLTFSISKPVIIYCSVKTSSGDFLRHSFECSMNDLKQEPMADGRFSMNVTENIALIQNYFTLGENFELKRLKHLRDIDQVFFWQAQLTIFGLEKVFHWVQQVSKFYSVHQKIVSPSK